MRQPAPIEELLGNIVEWGNRIARYVAGMDLEGFRSDQKTQDAVIRCLEVMGEASGQILKFDPSFQEKHPEFALSEAYRARNRTAHGYGSVDIETVWRSATSASPILVANARKILVERQSQSG